MHSQELRVFEFFAELFCHLPIIIPSILEGQQSFLVQVPDLVQLHPDVIHDLTTALIVQLRHKQTVIRTLACRHQLMCVYFQDFGDSEPFIDAKRPLAAFDLSDLRLVKPMPFLSQAFGHILLGEL